VPFHGRKIQLLTHYRKIYHDFRMKAMMLFKFIKLITSGSKA